MSLFEDNVFPGGDLSQPWLDANDPASHKANIILSTLTSAVGDDGSLGILSVADSESGPFGRPQGCGLWYEGNQCMIQDPIGAY
jgi:hypothetical protein